MTSRPDNPAGSERGEASALDPALSDALRAVLGPLARLALARGMSCAAMEELLKEAFVEEARKAQTVQTHARMISRISVATGLNRREVTRLTHKDRGTRVVRSSPASEVFSRWMTDPAWHDAAGEPRALPRVPAEPDGPAFETLAHLPSVLTGSYRSASLRDFLVDAVEIHMQQPVPMQIGGDLLKDRRDFMRIELADEPVQVLTARNPTPAGLLSNS